jgi:hypothetical protein
MKLSIKEVMCDVKVFNDTMYLSDSDCNRVLNHKTRSKRGKSMSKENLVDLSLNTCLKYQNQMYYPLVTSHIDTCYHNTKTLAPQ